MKTLQHTSLIIIAALSFILNSCKNELKLNAPYKEIPSIYAVINPQDKIQMIRINKVFLGESDATTMASVADSINYQPGDLTVTLNRYVNGAQVDASPQESGSNTITFRDSVILADPGVFNRNQRVYVCSEDLHEGQPGQPTWRVYGDYVLTVKNNKTGNVFTAKAAAVDSVKPSYIPFIGLSYPVPPNPLNNTAANYIDYSNPNSSYTIRFTANEAVIYQLLMRIHYYDSVLNNPANNYKNYSYVDFAFTNQYAKDKNITNGSLSNTFKGQSIYDAVGSAMAKLPPNPDLIGRRTYMVEFFVYSSTQEYMDYLQYAAPSLSINQDKHLYSNFTNSAALGIFTFRARCSVKKEMDNSFKTEFKTNYQTCPYKFFNASATGAPGC